MRPQLVCEDCGEVCGALDWHCEGARLRIANLPRYDHNARDCQSRGLWRYAAMLPANRRVSLGAGDTPLVPVQLDAQAFHAKLEYCNPTGSFKDRGTELMVNHFLANGVDAVVEDSSGNAGASLAAYAAAAGIRARIFAPADAPAAKLAHIRAYGADLVTVPGPRQAAADACLAAAETAVYASHAWSPFFVAGQMTCAWEIFEQGGAPDVLLCCAGHGGLFTGLARGFAALKDAGLIERLPRMVVAQAAACDPLVRAWESGLDETPALSPTASVADGISVALPVHGTEILRALRDTDGAALRVSDVEILAAQRRLWRQGLLAEPTSAVPVAALLSGQLPLEGRIVIPLTGSGLKLLA
ncbi:MAG: pyridoxal-phosphate dependent enzyme [Anaerolineaceae bacterium]|nr:pyridoxal-phosphate dependent enzyme [Anaerolineaceae bacterium]